jgi:hypothetical protein
MSNNDHHLRQQKEDVDNEGNKDKLLYQLSKLFEVDPAVMEFPPQLQNQPEIA